MSADVDTRMPVDDPAVGAPIFKFVSIRVPKEFVTRFEKGMNEILGFMIQFVHDVLDEDGVRVDTLTLSPLIEAGTLIVPLGQDTR